MENIESASTEVASEGLGTVGWMKRGEEVTATVRDRPKTSCSGEPGSATVYGVGAATVSCRAIDFEIPERRGVRAS